MLHKYKEIIDFLDESRCSTQEYAIELVVAHILSKDSYLWDLVKKKEKEAEEDWKSFLEAYHNNGRQKATEKDEKEKE